MIKGSDRCARDSWEPTEELVTLWFLGGETHRVALSLWADRADRAARGVSWAQTESHREYEECLALHTRNATSGTSLTAASGCSKLQRAKLFLSLLDSVTGADVTVI